MPAKAHTPDNHTTQGFKANIAIIGTGPAGVYCALQLVEHFKETRQNAYKISLFDHRPALATILPTGGGRCNLTFDEADFKKFASFYPRGEKFLYSILSRYSTRETQEYFKKIGIKTYTQPDRRVFPVSNSAKDVQNRMISALKKSKNINFIKKDIKNIKELDKYSILVLATGSKDRYKLAQQFGHKVIPLKPSLCGLTIKELSPDFPTGLSISTDNGGIIFTHQGLSGPEIFIISSKNAYKSYPYKIKIPILNPDKVFELINANPKKSFGNIVSELIPKNLTKYIFERYGLNYDKQAAHAKKDEIKTLETLDFTITGTDGRGEIVHAGGVCVDEIDKNCRSKIIKNLWIIGETLNIDGFCGGFNLQNCWSSAAVAADDIVKFCKEM